MRDKQLTDAEAAAAAEQLVLELRNRKHFQDKLVTQNMYCITKCYLG